MPPNTLRVHTEYVLVNQWVRSLVGLITSAGTGEYFPPLQLTCRNCGGGDRGRVALYRPFGEFHRAKIVLSPVCCSRPTTGVPLALATMNFVGLDLTTSDSEWDYTNESAVLDGDFEWVCSTITLQNIYGRTPMIILLTMRPSRLFVKIRCHAVASTRKRSAVRK
ncbi:hypothetical protein TNCV_543041 [Trichonephila clavipes]|nr:hypothetical protein TNCV_543041 [Trichonephila clavipes]